jgi:hypothetical protein
MNKKSQRGDVKIFAKPVEDFDCGVVLRLFEMASGSFEVELSEYHLRPILYRYVI